MAITYPLNFPLDVGMTDAVLTAKNAVSFTQSPFSFSQQVYSWSGEQWVLSVQMPLMKRADAEKFKVFLTKLKGSFGTFTCYAPSGREMQNNILLNANFDEVIGTESGEVFGTESGLSFGIEGGKRTVKRSDGTLVFSGNIFVNGANQSGDSISLGGFEPNVTEAVTAGDYLQVGEGLNTRLYKSLSNAGSDANGNLVLDIWPSLQLTPADREIVFFDDPKGLFRLGANSIDFASDYLNLFNLSFTAISV